MDGYEILVAHAEEEEKEDQKELDVDAISIIPEEPIVPKGFHNYEKQDVDQIKKMQATRKEEDADSDDTLGDDDGMVRASSSLEWDDPSEASSIRDDMSACCQPLRRELSAVWEDEESDR